MGYTNFPNGVTSFGIPLAGGAQIPATTGKYWFVSSTMGSNGNDGKSTVKAFASIAQANLAATANSGDVVIVMPGHVETVSAAAGINLSKAGVYYIGMGFANTRPTITFATATTATLTVTAADVTLDNFVFTQTFDAIVSPIVVSAEGFTMRNCYSMTANASVQCTQMILTTASASNMVIQNCRFEGTSDAGTTSAITIVGGDNIQILDNDFVGGYTTTTGGVQNITTATTNYVIRRNTIINLTASATKAVTMVAGSTGIVSENKFGIGSGAAPITSAGGWRAGNWTAAAVATDSTLV